MNPAQDIVGCGAFVPVGLRRTVDHDDRKTKAAGRSEFCVSPRAAGVFRHDKIDVMGLHQGCVGGLGKRAAIDDDFGLRQGQRGFRWVHEAQEVAMLRVGREIGQMHAAHGEHDIARRTLKGRDGRADVGDVGPVIAGLRAPWRPGQRDQRHARRAGGCDGVVAHLAGERVRGVDQMGDLVGAQIGRKPLRPAKPADALRQRLTHGAIHAARETDGAAEARIGHGARQCGRLGRAAKDQEVRLHV